LSESALNLSSLLAAGREWFILLLARARVDHEKMMRAKARGTFPDAMKEPTPPPSAAAAKVDEWEVRPGGMLVQKRSPDAAAPVPNIRVKVKFNGVYHEIYISAQASFGNAPPPDSAAQSISFGPRIVALTHGCR
jgi:hypothetical protein